MAAAGDSITRAFDTGLPLVDVPANSWSTGTNPVVASHYSRIVAAHPAIAGRAYNHARTGSRVAALQGQLALAAAQGVDYVTILIGGNDVCRSSDSAMTSVEDFRAQFAAALATFSSARPDARIYVSSIPDLYHLWGLLHDHVIAPDIWDFFNICESMLARPFSTDTADVERRQRVRDRVIAYNAQLAAVCAAFVHCRSDGDAVFGEHFGEEDVPPLDFFHPSVAGQRHLAALTWATGFDFSDRVPPMSTAVVRPPAGRAATVTLSASDDVGVSGVEYRVGAGPYRRYTGPFLLTGAQVVTYRSVDVNGNAEASKILLLR